ncbi:MAG: bifunctional aspartate kinase/homoserine dehydrogenase I [Paludibacteraceae bacterium]|nr:bifunctional aspartate kinase/homoserine dehydrogenase I [Paludibacteraceae bacterium]
MKVLKFGGTSVGSVESVRQIQGIIREQTDDCIVVVSALGGITDQLLKAARLALTEGEEYMEVYQAIRQRHMDMINNLITNAVTRQMLSHEVEGILDELRSILFGVHLVKDLSEKSEAVIVSYGEQLSSRIVTAALPGAVRKDSLQFIRTDRKQGQVLLNTELTEELVKQHFSPLPHLAVVPGFISRDSKTHEITNLGRGGSDYTASILAATLGAEVLEIWTDVDGFMTADPRLIPSAYTIKNLSYVEASELCHFGAKVVYPPTIYPACAKNIPIRILNTFRPENTGTIIQAKPEESIRYVRGLSSIRDVALITVSGLSMVGVIGVNQRIFSALATAGVSVFLVSQASSENSTTLGVQDKDCDTAVEALTKEFGEEIKVGSMYPMLVQQGLAAVSIVGENMYNTPGVAGKLFGTLGRNGISVIAFAQGAKETNISFVVPQQQLSKTMNVLHDSFFLSENKVLNLFICGVGTVGAQLIEQIQQQYEPLLTQQHLQLNVVGIANSRTALFNAEGLNLDTYREQLKQAETGSSFSIKQAAMQMASLYNSVFVDCTASAEVAGIYLTLLENNISVVTANKIAASSEYSHYVRLKQTALDRGVKFLFETNVGAGLPIIGTINDLRNSGDKILRIEAVVSGTLNFIFNEIAADVPFSETIRRAKEQGYSEPDPRIDLSGKDVIRKLVILAREAGYQVEQEDVEKQLFVPEEYFQGSVEEFWKRLPALDAEFEARRQELEKKNMHWRFVATLDEGKTRVSLETVGANHPFYQLEGSNNIVLITTERYHDYPMMIRGYGAGASVTAAGVFANIMSVSR